MTPASTPRPRPKPFPLLAVGRIHFPRFLFTVLRRPNRYYAPAASYYIMDQPDIRNILLYLSLAPGTLILAEATDGALRLFHNGQPLAPSWPSRELSAAIAAYYQESTRLARSTQTTG
jgi:hypothetical protein